MHPEVRSQERHGVHTATRRVPQRPAPRSRGPNRRALLAIVDVASAGLTPEEEPAPAVALEAIVDLASSELERQEQVLAKRRAEEERAADRAGMIGRSDPDEEQRFHRWLSASEVTVKAHKDETGWEEAPAGALGRLRELFRRHGRVERPAAEAEPPAAEPAPHEAQIVPLGMWDPVPEGRRRGR